MVEDGEEEVAPRSETPIETTVQEDTAQQASPEPLATPQSDTVDSLSQGVSAGDQTGETAQSEDATLETGAETEEDVQRSPAKEHQPRNNSDVESQNTTKGDNQEKNDPDVISQKSSIPDTTPIDIGSGPYSIFPIIRDLPNDVTYTCFECYDEHVYLGTNTGELLHYFEIEEGHYMLVSRTHFDSTTSAPIERIILLPIIERALVFSNRQLFLFLLPEFAPVPNSHRVRKLNEVVLESWGGNKDKYRIIVFTKDGASILKVSETNFQRVRKLPDLKGITRASIKDKTLICSADNKYQIISLQNGQTTPLFKISEVESTVMAPIIVDLGSDEFLVCSGGETSKDEAMALILNYTGDISQGTLVLKEYPRAVHADYPHILITYDSGETCVYCLSTNEEPRIVQVMNSNKNNPLQLGKTLKKFKNFARDEKTAARRDSIVDKLRYTAYSSHTDISSAFQFRIDRERAHVEDLFEETTSNLLCDGHTLYGLIASPFFMRINSFTEDELTSIESYLELLSKKPKLSSFLSIEFKYLILLSLLLQLLHCQSIGIDIIKKWALQIEVIDLRILFILFGLRVYGECWAFNGLKSLVENLQSLKLVNKCSNNCSIVQILKLLRETLRKYGREGKGKHMAHYASISKTVDVNLFIELLKTTGDIDIGDFESENLEEIISLVADDPNCPKDLLQKLYEKRGMISEVITLLKDQGKVDEALSFMKSNVSKMTSQYIGDHLLDDIMFCIVALMEGEEDIETHYIKEILGILSAAKIDFHDLIERVDTQNLNVVLRVHILESIGVQKDSDKNFLINYYMGHLEETIQSGKLWELLDMFLEEYKHDFNYSKMDIRNYLLTRLKYNDRCENFLTKYDSLISVCGDDPRLLNVLKCEVSRIDRGNVLLILFFFKHGDEGLECSVLPPDQFFKVLMNVHDFSELDKLVTVDNLVEIMSHYSALATPTFAGSLIVELLQRNIQLVHGNATLLLAVLQDIPPDVPLSVMDSFLSPLLRDYDFRDRNMEIVKKFCKVELSIYNRAVASAASDT
ncbi:CORVET complex subunit VPS3 KNAG_0K02200 [Huiozyma naganishii CBS 8797]|uniref:CNH domain-containing protein n=1 Tax=Huiozyma naganishii (strain ATCC MYA-139 / BCRC 22969 / CBS 8797 / KCTC 17520 / NBRC 10181 / NCYC 3082 / Yp74L-3) TaxID=1071383 RepID=J7RRU1_HUIN7|nr:hypothetical protein KNAG_0K02200 [Kazachstania naganishii CBS 8797]CCK72583.1 hypothetical protein KNAG_0K02200 [Kazachstania naganishii CBS 8797]